MLRYVDEHNPLVSVTGRFVICQDPAEIALLDGLQVLDWRSIGDEVVMCGGSQNDESALLSPSNCRQTAPLSACLHSQTKNHVCFLH